MSDHNIISLPPEVKKCFPYAKEKLVIDFINGIDVASKHNQVRKQESGLFTRFKNSLSGRDRALQLDTEHDILVALQACHSFYKDLCQDIEKNAGAILVMNECLQHTQHHVGEIANYLEGFKHEFKDVSQQLQNDINWTKRLVLAEQQIDRLFRQWGSGDFNNLPPLARCYAVLDTLYWGAFGERIKMDGDAQDCLADLEIRLKKQLREDLQIEDETQDIPYLTWLSVPDMEHKTELLDALQYQGDWCLSAPSVFSTTVMATQKPLLLSHNKEYNGEIGTLKMLDIKRATSRLIFDRFDKERGRHE